MVHELELPRCKFCPGVLKPDIARKEKARGYRFYRCEACDMPNIYAEPNPVIKPVWMRKD